MSTYDDIHAELVARSLMESPLVFLWIALWSKFFEVEHYWMLGFLLALISVVYSAAAGGVISRAHRYSTTHRFQLVSPPAYLFVGSALALLLYLYKMALLAYPVILYIWS